MLRPPKDCPDMPSLRAEIDALDSELVALLALRAGYIDRAAEIKQEVGLPARIPDRVEEVVARVRARAEAEALDPDLVEGLWRALIDWAIRREAQTLGPDEAAEPAGGSAEGDPAPKDGPGGDDPARPTRAAGKEPS